MNDWSWNEHCRFSLVETRSTYNYNRWNLSDHIQSIGRERNRTIPGSQYDHRLSRTEQALIQVSKYGHFAG